MSIDDDESITCTSNKAPMDRSSRTNSIRISTTLICPSHLYILGTSALFTTNRVRVCMDCILFEHDHYCLRPGEKRQDNQYII